MVARILAQSFFIILLIEHKDELLAPTDSVDNPLGQVTHRGRSAVLNVPIGQGRQRVPVASRW